MNLRFQGYDWINSEEPRFDFALKCESFLSITNEQKIPIVDRLDTRRTYVSDFVLCVPEPQNTLFDISMPETDLLTKCMAIQSVHLHSHDVRTINSISGVALFAYLHLSEHVRMFNKTELLLPLAMGGVKMSRLAIQLIHQKGVEKLLDRYYERNECHYCSTGSVTGLFVKFKHMGLTADLMYIVCAYLLRKPVMNVPPEKILSQLDKKLIFSLPSELMFDEPIRLQHMQRIAYEYSKKSMHRSYLIPQRNQSLSVKITQSQTKCSITLPFSLRITQIWSYVTAQYRVPRVRNSVVSFFKIIDCIRDSELHVEAHQTLDDEKVRNSSKVLYGPIHTITFHPPGLIDSNCPKNIEDVPNFSHIDQATLDLDLKSFGENDFDPETIMVHVGASSVNVIMEEDDTIRLKFL